MHLTAAYLFSPSLCCFIGLEVVQHVFKVAHSSILVPIIHDSTSYTNSAIWHSIEMYAWARRRAAAILGVRHKEKNRPRAEYRVQRTGLTGLPCSWCWFAMATNMLTFYCGFLPLENCKLFFREANFKKGKQLMRHVFVVEEIIQADEHQLNAKCVSQVQDNVVYNMRLKVNAVLFRAVSSALGKCLGTLKLH